ncbi:MAG: class I SAM-dependent methyltransferase [Gemmatimonadetes bacterium]|jgi:SAM-dependent methyltransferase|nr:class I SAM-dependent methyltransferase [Gemmatimonadota bacterium]MBT5057522.1 class I SAM-dependent methyltransferase [Gemmatimonadota bacterium]MBT5146725.1 class I SAM-dependent methyltransferase [Gemmatimonadota bacterium]MBT5588589.1 class I SAM-dependent methyltransferase [Gemmatimonadota bacterium]MBT5962569.1 class I SAM-dependent methyltransferase [Gemmatimonadota bacterium]
MVTVPEDLPPDQEYDGVLARYYDAYFTGLEGEESYYRTLALNAEGPVLELGCGSGRTLIPIAQAGVSVVGVERSQQMLALARSNVRHLPDGVAREIELLAGDMRSFDLGREFALITLPYRTFQHLLTIEDQHLALERICAHLRPGGLLALNVFDPLMDIAQLLTSPDPAEPAIDGEFQDEGRQIRARYLRGYDPAQQWMVQHFWFDEIDGDRVLDTRQARLTLRYAFRFEMEHLLQNHGLLIKSVHGGFDGEQYAGWGEQVWVARKP